MEGECFFYFFLFSDLTLTAGKQRQRCVGRLCVSVFV